MQLDPQALEEFKQLSELLRFYTNLVLQTVTFVLTAAGAVVAYAVKDPCKSAYGFAIPSVLCFGMGVGFLLNFSSALELVNRLQVLAQTLKFGLAPHGTILLGALLFFGLVLSITGIVFAVLLVRLRHKEPELPQRNAA